MDHAEKFNRRPFVVDAWKVTDENMRKVAKWCDGKIEKMQGSDVSYIFVRVANPTTDRQNKAFVGNWVVYMPGSGYKVFAHKSFRRTFQPIEKEEINLEEAAEKLSAAKGVRVIKDARLHSVSLDAEPGIEHGSLFITPTSTEDPALTEGEADGRVRVEPESEDAGQPDVQHAEGHEGDEAEVPAPGVEDAGDPAEGANVC